MYSLV